MRPLLTALIVLSLNSWTTAAPVPKGEKDTTEKLVGTWKLSKGVDNLGDTTEFFVEFTKDGKLIISYNFKEQKITQTIKGTFKAEKDKIHYTMDTGNGEKRETLTIQKLDDDDLVVVDPDDKKEEFKKVKSK